MSPILAPQRARAVVAPTHRRQGELAAVRVAGGVVWVGGEDDEPAAPNYVYVGAYSGGWTHHHITDPSADAIWGLAVPVADVWATDRFTEWRGPSWVGGDTSGGGALQPNHFYAIAAASDTDVYLAGDYGTVNPAAKHARHWDGSAWGDVAIPGTAGVTTICQINTLDMDPSGDCWFGGEVGTGALIGSLGTGVGALAADRVFGLWARTTGDQWATAQGHAYADYWQIWRNTGGGWARRTGLPGLPADVDTSGVGRLTGIHGVSGSDVWAVGYYPTIGSTPYVDALLWYWDGSAWGATARPSLPATDDTGAGTLSNVTPAAVYAAAANDVWVAGSCDYSTGRRYMLLWQWDGSAWSDRSPRI